MYNETIKNDYIKVAVENNKNLLDYLTVKFSALEKFENKNNKDLYDFSTSEIIDMYKSLFYGSLETLLTLNSQLKKYTSYCSSRNLVADGQNHYLEFDNKILLSCVNTVAMNYSIISRKELLEAIEELYNPSDKFICLAYFEGLKGKEFEDVLNLRASNFNGNIVSLESGRTLEVSDELVKIALSSAETYDYLGYIMTNDSRERNFTFKENDDRVLKDLYNVVSSSEKTQKRNIYTKLTRIREYMGLDIISAKSLNESGRIDLLQRLYKSNEYPSYKTCYIDNKEAIEYRYGKLYSIDRWLEKYGKFL